MNNRNQCAERTVLITGAGRGIGLCLARHFLDAGANIALLEADATLKTPALQRLENSPRCLFVKADVADEPGVRSAIQQTLKAFGRLDVLIHNAAISAGGPVEQLAYADWRRVIDTNLSGAFLCAKHAAAELRARRGAILLIASTRAGMSEPHTEAYSASKAGLVGLTHALAMSLAPVRVNCISPGWIVTDDWQHDGRKTSLTEQDQAQHPVGRVGRPEDVAAMADYLCSDRTGFVTGQNFVVDGGMTKKMIYC
ncbi:MAG: SDR family oxidoreductase [Lentisphaerae bacterium]|nr:SDR family oxidoreductase [Lentisphaerota bacterium]